MIERRGRLCLFLNVPTYVNFSFTNNLHSETGVEFSKCQGEKWHFSVMHLTQSSKFLSKTHATCKFTVYWRAMVKPSTNPVDVFFYRVKFSHRLYRIIIQQKEYHFNRSSLQFLHAQLLHRCSKSTQSHPPALKPPQQENILF